MYNLNIPLIEGLLSEEGLKIYWTTMWRNTYGRLFKHIEEQSSVTGTNAVAGPDAPVILGAAQETAAPASNLVFKWAPDMEHLIRPSASSCPVGSDGWAIRCGHVSVTPLRASFGEPPHQVEEIEERVWKMKL